MADNPLKYSDLVSPDSSIIDAISQLEKLSDVYEQTIKKVRAEADALKSSMTGLSGATEEQRGKLKGAASDADRLAKAQRDLTFAQSDAAVKLATLKQQLIDQNQVNKMTIQVNASVEGSYEQLAAQLKRNEAELRVLGEQHKQTSARGMELVSSNRALSESLEKMEMDSRAVVMSNKALAQAEAQLAFASSDAAKKVAELNLAQQTQMQTNKLNAAFNLAQEGSYNKLSAQYSLNKIKLNNMGEAWQTTTAEGKKFVAQTNEIYQSMIRLQEATGNHKLSVGNYSKAFNGLNHSVAQLTRELPSLKMGMGMFFLAISNNLPMMFDELSRAKEATAALHAEGKKGPSIWKQLGGALISWQTLLSVGVTLLTLYGAKFFTWLVNAIKGTDAITQQTITLKAYNDVLKEGASGIGAVVSKQVELGIVLNKARAGTYSADEAVKKYNETLGKAFGYVDSLDGALTGYVKHTRDFVMATLNQMAAVKLLDAVSAKVSANTLARIANSALPNTDALQEQYQKTIDIAKKLKEGNGLELLAKYMESPGQTFKETSGYASELYNSFSRLYNMKGGGAFVKNANIIAENNVEINKTIKATEQLLGKTVDVSTVGKEVADLTTLLKEEAKAAAEALPDEFESQREALRAAYVSQKAEIDAQIASLDKSAVKSKEALTKTLLSKEKKLNLDLAKVNEDQAKQQEEDRKKRLEAAQKEQEMIAYNRALSMKVTEQDLNMMEDSSKKRNDILTAGYEKEREKLQSQLLTDKNLNEEGRTAINKLILGLDRKLIIDRAKLKNEDDLIKIAQEKAALQLSLSAVEKNSEEENTLKLRIIENARKEALAKNNEATAEMRQSEVDINAAFDREALTQDLGFRYAKEMQAFDSDQKLKQSEFDLLKTTEEEKTRFKLQAEKDRFLKILELNKISLEKLSTVEIEAIKNLIKAIDAEISKSKSDEKTKDIYSIMGLKLKDEEKQAIDESVSFAVGQLNDFMEAKVRVAEAAVAASEKEVSAAQSVLDNELDLRKEGYANRVESAAKDLETAKKNQAKALAEQKRAQRAQQTIDTLQQTSSLITASAKIWRDLPFFMAIPALAIMWGSFISAKTKAREVTKVSDKTYGEGGLEFLEGGSHASGKDIPIGRTKDGRNRKAEGGEAMAIIRKQQTRKYRNVLPSIVDSLNKGVFEETYGRNLGDVSYLLSMNTPGVDLKTLETEVKGIRQQGETRYYTDGNGRRMRKYKNLTTIYK